jgi:hypothetical protein
MIDKSIKEKDWAYRLGYILGLNGIAIGMCIGILFRDFYIYLNPLTSISIEYRLINDVIVLGIIYFILGYNLDWWLKLFKVTESDIEVEILNKAVKRHLVYRKILRKIK